MTWKCDSNNETVKGRSTARLYNGSEIRSWQFWLYQRFKDPQIKDRLIDRAHV